MKKTLSFIIFLSFLLCACVGNDDNAKSEHQYVVGYLFGTCFAFVDDPVQREKTENAVQEMNENSWLGYNLLSPHDDNVRGMIQRECNGNWINNYMSVDYSGEGIQWIFAGYPHDECPYFLVQTSFSSNKYNVFGIKPGDDVLSSMKVLEDHGFELEEDMRKIYTKGDLCITLLPSRPPMIGYEQDDYTKIHTVDIKVRTFYLGNRTY